MDPDYELFGKVLGTSTSTSPSSARSTKLTILGSPVAKTVDFDLAKPQEDLLNKNFPSRPSFSATVAMDSESVRA